MRRGIPSARRCGNTFFCIMLCAGRGYSATLQAGEIFVIRPGEVTYYEADMRDPWEYMWAGFDCAPPFAALLEQDVLRLPGALQNFSRIAGCGDMPAKEWRICAQLYELFAELDAARGPAQGHGGNYVGQAVNYIESNYSQPMRVQDIAAGLGLNRSYFCRLFRQQTGLSPQEYIVSCRLAKAAQFMTEHGMSQEEAARQAGYPDVFSFSRMFRRKYGMPAVMPRVPGKSRGDRPGAPPLPCCVRRI